MLSFFINKYSFKVHLFRAATFLAIFGSNPLAAQSDNDFFGKNDALTVFNTNVTEKSNSRFSILKQRKEEKKVELAPNTTIQEGQAAQAIPAVSTENTAPLAANTSENLSDPKAIVAKFGDPTKDAPVLAQDNAPAPFKGMMAALDAGDDKLAFQYARQYVRHIRNLEQRAKRAVNLQTIALGKEGYITEGSWKNNPEYQADIALLDDELKDKSDPAALIRQNSNINNIDPRAKKFLDKAMEMEGQVEANKPEVNQTVEDKSMSQEERVARGAAYRAIAGQVPVDPKGEVDIYFFFRPSEKHSIEMGAEMQSLFSVLQANPKARIVGLTMDMETDSTVKTFQAKTKAAFPIANGSIFAKNLKITTVPTTVFVTRSNGSAIFEKGVRQFYFLDELVKYMQGGK